MSELTVFEENGKLLTDSREVAMMIEKPHYDLMKAIRGYCKHLTEGEISLSEYFIETSYQDSTGRTLPCYLCTKKGCDMIANKMTGKKGVIFTAKYVSAFEKMQEFIKGASNYVGIPFKEQVESLEVVANMLHLNDASKLLMMEKFYDGYNIPTTFLPKYEYNGNRELKSVSALLKENGCQENATKFNKMLVAAGFLEERERPSSKGATRKFKALSEKGLQYGENAISPHNMKEVQPQYYRDSFMELYSIITNTV